MSHQIPVAPEGGPQTKVFLGTLTKATLQHWTRPTSLNES